MPKRLKGKTILIIEDDTDIRTFASRVLELEGYVILQADSGEKGLKLVRGTNVNLILLDLRLPGESGWTVIKKVKAEPGTTAVPIIVFTASVGMSQRKRAIALGAADYLTKPLSAAVLKNAVAGVLRQQPPPQN